MGPVPPQASGQVSPGLQRPEEGPPTAGVWSRVPCLSAQALPTPLHRAVCRKSSGSAARVLLSTSPWPHPVLGAWPAQNPGAAPGPVSMSRSREDPFICAVGVAVSGSRSFCGHNSVKTQRGVDSLSRKPMQTGRGQPQRSKPVGPLAAPGDPGQLPGQTGLRVHATCSVSGRSASVSGLSPPALPNCQTLSTPACFVLEAGPGHDRPSATAPEGLPLKERCKSHCVLCALPRPPLSSVRADVSAIQQEVAPGPLHQHPAVGAPSLAPVHPVASSSLPEWHLPWAPPWSESAPQAPEALPGTCVAAAPAVRAAAEGRVPAPAPQVRLQTAGPSRDACGVKSAARSPLTAAPRLFWELELRPWPRCSHPPSSRESGLGRGCSLLCHGPGAPAGHHYSGWGRGGPRWAPGGDRAATSRVPGQLRLGASGACPPSRHDPRGFSWGLGLSQGEWPGSARPAAWKSRPRRLPSAERSCVRSSPVARPSPAQP